MMFSLNVEGRSTTNACMDCCVQSVIHGLADAGTEVSEDDIGVYDIQTMLPTMVGAQDAQVTQSETIDTCDEISFYTVALLCPNPSLGAFDH